MKRVISLMLLFVFPILMFCQTSTIKQVQKEIENEITIAESEIRNCNVKLKINKNDAEANYVFNQNKVKLKELEEDLKLVKKTIKAEKEYNDIVEDYNKKKSIYDSNVSSYILIKDKYSK